MGEGGVGVKIYRAQITTMKKHPVDGARDRACALRYEMTRAERRLWRILRSRQIDGYGIRRQVRLGRYIVDFVCHEARLIIEVDGGQYDTASPPEPISA